MTKSALANTLHVSPLLPSVAVPSAASGHANGYRSQHTATHPTASNTGDYSYANPNRVIFSLPPPRCGRSHAGAHPNTRLEDPRPYEVPQPTYESTGTTLRHSVLPQESKRQLSHTGATIVAQPRSALSPTRPGRHPKHHPTGPTQDAIQHFASPSPALPPKGIRASSGSASHSGRDERSAHYKLNLAPDPRGSNDCPLPAAGCDGDTFPALPQSHYITLTEDASAMVEAATSVPICATPPPLPPKPNPSTVTILSHPGASVDLQESVPWQGKSDMQ